MLRLAALAMVAMLGMAGAAAAEEPVAEAPPLSLIAGTWTISDKAQVTFLPCAVGECGYLSRLVVPEQTYATNKEAIDKMGVENLNDARNPDPALKSRPVLGLPIVILKTKVSPVRYEGQVYNPEDGNTYDGIVELVDADTLKLTGCAFLILCQSQEWKRVSEEDLAYAAEHEAELPGNVGVWHPPVELTTPGATPAAPAPATPSAPAPVAPAAPAAPAPAN